MSSPIRRKLLRVAAWTGLALSILVLVLLIVCDAIILFLPTVSLEGIGNGPDVTEKIATGGGDFRFVVFGDTQKGIGSFRRLGAVVSGVDFAVHCGDMVAANDEGHWLLFFDAVGVRPMIAAAGNHDVKRGWENFDRYFGLRQISFRRGSCRFIVLDASAPGPFRPGPLAVTLQSVREPDIFLFLHRPPFDARQDGVVPREGWEPFFDLVRRHRVRYVFSGHAHAYVRREHEGTVFIANGEGGDYDSWALDTKVSATVMDVATGRVRDERLTVDPVHGVWENVLHLAVGHVWMEFRHKPLPCWGALLLLLVFDAFLVFLLRRLRKA
ncbi:MAG: metallophosphoesterase family protein [Planctomycetota bacterium]|jgi:predicted phosphodiesterase